MMGVAVDVAVELAVFAVAVIDGPVVDDVDDVDASSGGAHGTDEVDGMPATETVDVNSFG